MIILTETMRVTGDKVAYSVDVDGLTKQSYTLNNHHVVCKAHGIAIESTKTDETNLFFTQAVPIVVIYNTVQEDELYEDLSNDIHGD